MDGQHMATPGYLTSGTDKVEIEASPASKYSLLINCCNGKRIGNQSSFSNVVVNIDGEHFELGPGRIMVEPDSSDRTARLVFTGDVYDLESLFSQKKADHTAIFILEPAARFGSEKQNQIGIQGFYSRPELRFEHLQKVLRQSRPGIRQ